MIWRQNPSPPSRDGWRYDRHGSVADVSSRQKGKAMSQVPFFGWDIT
jgi:hypothetical protein